MQTVTTMVETVVSQMQFHEFNCNFCTYANEEDISNQQQCLAYF